MIDSRALAEFLRANLDKVPAPAGYREFREKVKTIKPIHEVTPADAPDDFKKDSSAPRRP